MNKPGIYFDVPVAGYFADPCPVPSLTQSIAKILADEKRAPAHAWQCHPRLNPDFEPDDSTKYDIGNVAHSLLIGRGKEISVIDFDDWRGKAAKEAREEGAKAGKLVVLRKQFDRAADMVVAARKQLDARGHESAFSDGRGEVMITWQEDQTWFRSLIDWMGMSPTYHDYKTTALSCAPRAVEERPGELGWDIQAAMHERGLDVLDPNNAGRRVFYFVAQEDYPPYALNIVEMSESDMTLGRKKLDMAVDIWRRCMASNIWPAYPPEVVLSRPRGWTETRWLEREAEYAERPPVNALEAG
jgi:hypothetical protein